VWVSNSLRSNTMNSFQTTKGKKIVLDLVNMIQTNASYLSEIDGAIGDGDHGVNMSKGFTLAKKSLAANDVDLYTSLYILGDTLFTEIGGAMGPLYGTFFMEMAEVCKYKADIDRQVFGQMLRTAFTGVQDIGGAKLGDKSIIDTLAPATAAYEEAVANGKMFSEALQDMVQAAERGKESTRNMIAKIGRASRLGERSRGVLDAGATSCWLILTSIANSIDDLIS